MGCGVVDCRVERRDLTGRDKAFTGAVQDEVIESLVWGSESGRGGGGGK